MGLGEKKSVLISIRPKWCELIASGKKTVEVRKTRPKIETPFKCYIYETKGKADMPTFVDEDGHVSYEVGGQVIGEFVCDIVYHTFLQATGGHEEDIMRYFLLGIKEIIPKFLEGCCLEEEIAEYIPPGGRVWGWHISDLKIYDKPRELKEFGSLIRVRDWERGTEHFGKNGRWYKPLKRPPQSWCYVEENSDAEIH